MKICLCNGGCALRFKCRNVDKKVCKIIPNEGDDFVVCEYYEPKWKLLGL